MKDIFVNISKLLFKTLDVSFHIKDVKKAELSRLGEKLISDLVLQVKYGEEEYLLHIETLNSSSPMIPLC